MSAASPTLSATETLLDFIPRATPRWVRPEHMAPLANLFERVKRGETVKAVVSVPPRFSKTETILHGLAWLLGNRPDMQLAYIGYGSTFAENKSRKARDIARSTGVPLSELAWARKNWRTGVGDGGVWATSIGGQVTGEGFHLMVVDDPVKDRASAESAAQRESTYEWFQGTAYTRLEPSGSCIVNHTRWHPDDLAGRLIADGFECINLPALTETGKHEDGSTQWSSLWPDRWPVAKLLEIWEQIGDYDWFSQYQGQPRGRGNSVFNDCCTYEAKQRPNVQHDAARVCIGIDFAYTAKTHADYNVAVVLAESGGEYFLLDVVRLQCEPRVFRDRVALLKETYPNATACTYVAATEKGGVEFVRDAGINISGLIAKADKFTRALPVAAAWNSKKILIPKGEHKWRDAFLGEVLQFTGVKDKHDDQVDALAAAFDGLRGVAPVDAEYLAQLNAALPKTQVVW